MTESWLSIDGERVRLGARDLAAQHVEDGMHDRFPWSGRVHGVPANRPVVAAVLQADDCSIRVRWIAATARCARDQNRLGRVEPAARKRHPLVLSNPLDG